MELLMKQFKLLVLGILISFTSIAFAQQEKSNSISMMQFKEQINANAEMILLDVRTPQELSGPLGKIDEAINIPVQELVQRIDELKQYKEKEILVICRTQNRSAVAVNILKQNGFNAKNILGGMTEFRK